MEVNTQVYTELLNKAQELKIVEASAVGNVRVLDHAMSRIQAVKPKKPLIAVLATLLGGMLGCGLVFVRQMLRQGVKTPAEIENKTGLSVYASIPLSECQSDLDRTARKRVKPRLLASEKPSDLACESLRSLRTNLVFALMEAKNNRIMITGPAPGVGKSFISINLGCLLAETNQKVLVVDGDMRKGHLNRYSGRDKKPGLSECIIGQSAVDETRVELNENLHVLSCGMYPPSPSELLMSPKFVELLDEVSEQYDIVIIDTPPALAVTDAAIIGKLCDTGFIIARADVNPAKEIENAALSLQKSGAEVTGCILNGINFKTSVHNHYGYYHYAHEA